MTAAERIVRVMCRLLPRSLRNWGEAMAQEAASIQRPAAAIAFAVSCGAWAVRAALGHAVRSALTPLGREYADLATRRTRWGPRDAALACAIAATLFGLVHLAEAGAPARYLILNLTALIAGLIIVLPFRRHNLVTAPFVGVVALLVGLALLVTAVLGEGAADARRWLSLGDVALQPSLLGLPFVLVAFARSRDIMTTAGLILGAIAIVLQSDCAMAAAMVAATGVAALMKRDRMALVMLSVATACFIVTAMRRDAMPAMSFVDGILRAGSSTSFIAGLAVWGGVAILLLPPVLGLRRSRESAAAHAAFGATWFALIAAAVFGDYPTPVVGYGGSAIVGYLWSLLALPGEISKSDRCGPKMGPHSRYRFTKFEVRRQDRARGAAASLVDSHVWSARAAAGRSGNIRRRWSPGPCSGAKDRRPVAHRKLYEP